VDVLDGIHLELASGEITDVIGPSGSGKTTLLRALARLLPEATGSLRLDGSDAADITANHWRKRVMLLPQVTDLIPGSVRENLLLPWTLKVRHGDSPPDEGDLREALDGVGLRDVDLSRDVSRLSVGQAARISLLRVILAEPAVLLLDEPDANLDDESAEQVAQMTKRLAEAGGTVVRVRHLRSDSLATRRLRLEHGHLEEVSA
jgi:putative ABC transport system ATP-binding protein